MANVSARITIDAPAEAVWQTARDFGGVGRWMAGVARCTVEGAGQGAVRTIVQADGGRVVEKLQVLDEAAHALHSTTLRSTTPVEHSDSSLHVRDLGDGRSEVEWITEFEPRGGTDDEAGRQLQAWCEHCLRRLKDLVTGHVPVCVTVALTAKKGKEEELRAALLGLQIASRVEEGCLEYTMHQSADDPREFLLHMKWRDAAAFDRHVENPVIVEFDVNLADKLLARHYTLQHWVELE